MKKISTFFTGIALLFSGALSSQITVDLKAFLEGPFFITEMTPWLNWSGDIPLSQPYGSSPWYYYGPESVTTLPNADVIDWVMVELRQTTGTASSAIQDSALARQVGFFLKDGRIVGIDGSSPLEFDVAVTSNLYAVIIHRNHLSIMSANPLPMSGGTYSWDFTTSIDKVYGGINGHKQIVTGIWGMISGDGDSNGNVNNSDKVDVWKPQSGNAGYLNGDFNMNSQVDNTDKIEYWKPNSGRSTQVPGGSLNTPPVAVIQVNPPTGTTITAFTLDASASYDNQSKPALLAARWDFENDGTWDTPYSTSMTITHQYSTAGDYTIKVEVIDVGGLTDTETYNLQVAQSYGVPCPGIPTVTYEGQVYNTVQIGTQCWLKENLNVGIMIAGSQNQANNQIIEKYCYDDDPVNCITYGGLYQWNEMMQYVTTPGVKGICPDGWHSPTDAEYCTLTQFIDPTVDCGIVGWIGTDAGTKMKSAAGWYGGGSGTNTSGFTALPGGLRNSNAVFDYLTNRAPFWSSSENGTIAWRLYLDYNYATINRLGNNKLNGFSVRCLKDVWSCGDTIIDARDGEVYNTVEIGTQCWMAENLNIGTMIQGSGNQTNNGAIEKYCHSDNTANCDVYGGLYQWDEMMQYVTTPGVKGICPDGWHLPTDAEWCVLEQYVDPTISCSATAWRGVDGGGKLKEAGTTHWAAPNTGATNSSGFTGLPGGYRLFTSGSFDILTYYGYFWCSSKSGSYAWYRTLGYNSAQVRRTDYNKYNGFSVRCLRDSLNQAPAQPSNPTPPDNSTDQQLNTQLSWSCTDPENDPLTYDVYFSTTNPPVLVFAGQTWTTYNPGTLDYSTTYYWKVVAHDDHSNATEGPVWSFTTEPQPWQCGNPFVDPRDNQEYTTVQIGTQCWMAENLNIGTMITGTSNQTNNGTLEKYCYSNSTANCDVYGGLYQWEEMMQYVTTPGVKGICPDGWHLPTDAEYCTLTQFIDPTVSCSSTTWSGTDVGTKMKSTTGWYGGGNGTNASGFTALPGGLRNTNSNFNYLAHSANCWSSSESGTDGLYRGLDYNNAAIERENLDKSYGFSVRCVKGTIQTWSCGDPIIDARDNQEYTTVHIGTQCWMAENMNIGTMINGSSNQTDNGTIEKYCYDNNTANCDIYGGLYQWNEMMQYVTTPGVKGICPDGWHLPTDAEYCTLTQFIDPTVNCSTVGWNGTDVGTKMKSTTGWYGGGNGTNASGFTALPGGYRYYSGVSFNGFTYGGYFWCSSESGSAAWGRYLYYDNTTIYRTINNRNYGFSVRCMKDTIQTWSCGDPITDPRDNQEYTTVQIGTQCWMAENLNIGTMIPGSNDQTDNGTIEKYCYDNNTANCDVYGGLYQWNEMMQYVTTPGVKGICPDGWHVPTDAEYCTLTQFIDPTVNCGVIGFSGTDTGTKMKSTTGWYGGGNGTNASGFTALPGGGHNGYGSFGLITYEAYFWSSSESSTSAWRRGLDYNYATINRVTNSKIQGFSVRCVKD